MNTKTLQQLQRRFDRLRGLQSRLVLPRITHFELNGMRFELPLKAKAVCPSKSVPQHTLEYLAGFFDGDGCVAGNAGYNNCQLTVAQAVSGSTVLLLFRSAFGGSISLFSTVGYGQPVLRWQLAGQRARQVASLLEPLTSCKRSQLRIAAAWPQAHDAKAEAATELKRLKHIPTGKASCLSWTYLAGFFDAEGCVSPTYPSTLSLIVVQKHPDILWAIQCFLAANGVYCQVATANTGKSARLTITKTDVSKHVLVKLLSEGLRAKRSTARAALHMSHENFLAVREDIFQTVGYQNRYNRLTVQGVKRARAIRSLQIKLRAAKDCLHPWLNEELQGQRLDHLWKCAVERCAAIRLDIRASLAHGAAVTSRTNQNKSCTICKHV